MMKQQLTLAIAIAALTLAACGKVEKVEPARTDAAVTTPARSTSFTPPPPPIVSGKPVEVVAHPDPLSALDNADPVLSANKHLVHDMWRTVLNAGHQEEAEHFIADNYIQHSPFQRSGRAAMMKMFAGIPRRDEVPPVMRPTPVSFIAEGSLVALVAIDSLPEPGDSGKKYTTTHFNLFRVIDGKAGEHWHPDRSPPCPELPGAADGGPVPVRGVSGDAQMLLLRAATPALVANKKLVFDMWRELMDAGREDKVEQYFAEDYIEHDPNLGSGREAAKAYIASLPDQPVEPAIRAPVVAMMAEDDIVILVTRIELPDPYRPGKIYTTVNIDMFRIADGRIAEHWDGAMKPNTNEVEMGSTCKK
jgi:predicted SnoaL-like aldol condensation-catalyzing enzyme